MKLGAEVAVATDEVSHEQQHDLDFIAVVVPPLPEPEVHSYSGTDSDSDGKSVSPPPLLGTETLGYVHPVHEIRVRFGRSV
jgi:hypothetical protein